MKKYTYRAGTGLAFSKTKDIEMFAQMAEEGYFPIKLNLLGIYKFEKHEPEEVVYAVDYSKLTPKSSDFNEYLEVFKGGGWEYVFGKDGVNFFKAPKGTTPLYTDKNDEAHMYIRMAKTMFPSMFIMLAIFALFVVIINVIGRSPAAICLWSLAGACAGVLAVMLFGYFRCRRQGTKLLK